MPFIPHTEADVKQMLERIVAMLVNLARSLGDADLGLGHGLGLGSDAAHAAASGRGNASR